MARFVTFKFDDGFIEGARKAIACLHPDRASFFLITGLVSESGPRPDHELFRGRNFGTIADWSPLAEQGHDVEPHSVTRPNFAELSVDRQTAEVRDSLDAVRAIHRGPYIFGFPFNEIVDLDL